MVFYYECVIEFWVGEFSGQQFFDTYAGLSTSMYIESITVAEEPFLGGDGTVSITFNPEYGDEYDFVFTDEYGLTQLIEHPSEDFQFPLPEEALTFSVIADNTSCPNGSDGVLTISISGVNTLSYKKPNKNKIYLLSKYDPHQEAKKLISS